MTFVRLGYVAMSVNLEKCSPSQTMTYAQFKKLTDREVAINKLERIACSNLENCLRLLKHNWAHNIKFFRLSSKLIPLATHTELEGWDYIKPLKEVFEKIRSFLNYTEMRIDFHPDHFVLLNSPREEVLTQSLDSLSLHLKLLEGMGIDSAQRCVIHIGGKYKDTETSLERFVSNWQKVPKEIQRAIMLENDDKSFTLQDTLYLCEKLEIPLVFDYHHHLANNVDENWIEEWERVVKTWSKSKLPVKVHISSPKSEREFRHHADFIEPENFLNFLNLVKGSVKQIDCMIEAKQKDNALFQLVREIRSRKEIKFVDEVNFTIH